MFAASLVLLVSSAAPAAALPKELIGKCTTLTDFVVEPKLKVVHVVDPVYPTQLVNKVEGHVRLFVTVGMDGAPLRVVVGSSTHPDFAKSAVAAVRQWRFEVPDFGDGPTCVNQTIDFDFRHK